MSPAEVDNYLIAAKMAHPDMLTVEEKMQWAKFHRQHMVVASNNSAWWRATGLWPGMP